MTAEGDDGGSRGRGTDGDYRELVENLSAHAIFRLDADGAITTWPEPARALYGHAPSAVEGETVSVLFGAEGELDRPLEEVLSAARDGPVTTDHWHSRADGSVFWGTMTLEPLWSGPDRRQFEGYAAVCTDTTERKQHREMLQRQNDRLKEFTDILAHDLRSPLTTIDGRLSLYRETGDEDHLDAVEQTTDRMERLVDDLLEVARQGNVVTDPEPTDLEGVVATAWGGVESGTDAAALEYETVGRVSADPDRLCELFENLFRNAVEHAGPDVTVRVGPLRTGFSVADDGPGVPADMREAVFDHGVSTSDDGSGYGLSIVRTIANAHGWDVVVTESPSGGAQFEVTGIELVE